MAKKTKRAALEATGGKSVGSDKRDKSPKVHQRDKIAFQLNIRERDDLTERQKVILETMLHWDTRAVFIDGLYGTAKTWMAVLAALKLLNGGRVDQLIYIRNPVESSSTGRVGFLPGDLGGKIAPYSAPLMEKLDELLPGGEIQALEKDGRIDSVPVGFVRGRSWNCKVVIVDEASSMSFEDLTLILTRAGPFTRVFFIGDSLNQNDIGDRAGFRRMFDRFDDDESKEHGIYTFELRQPEDIKRSPLLSFIMRKLGVIKDPVPTPADREPMFPPAA